MHIIIDRETLLKPLQLITNTIDKKQALPILSNILFKISEQQLTLLGTDLEIELIKYITLKDKIANPVELAVPAKKLNDICRALPQNAEMHFSLQGEQLLIRSGKSRFVLSLMSTQEFPTLDYDQKPQHTFSLPAKLLYRLFVKTYFSIALQDVRYFLNGLFIDFNTNTISAIAADGHRLAFSSLAVDLAVSQYSAVLLPRKAVLELIKLLEITDNNVDFYVGDSYVSVRTPDYCFTTKLIEASFPDYRRLIPKENQCVAIMDKNRLRDALLRVSVLSSEKYRSVWLLFEKNQLVLQANNPDKDEVEEELVIDYPGPAKRLGCNVTYVLDVLAVMDDEVIRLGLTETCLLIQGLHAESENYVVMSMYL